MEMYTSVKYLRAYKLLWNASILGLGRKQRQAGKMRQFIQNLVERMAPYGGIIVGRNNKAHLIV